MACLQSIVLAPPWGSTEGVLCQKVTPTYTPTLIYPLSQLRGSPSLLAVAELEENLSTRQICRASGNGYQKAICEEGHPVPTQKIGP